MGKKKEKKSEVDKTFMRRELVDALKGLKPERAPKFSYVFLKSVDSGREEHIYWEEQKNGELIRIGEQGIIDALSVYVMQNRSSYGLSARDLQGIVELWGQETRPIDLNQVALVLEKSQPGRTFRKLDFDFNRYASSEDFPYSFEYLRRSTNSAALCAFIGSLFFAEADRQQYFWIFGEGKNGKSALGRLLLRIMGPSGRSDQPPGSTDKFWTNFLIGKRLVIFPDCNNESFVTSGLFKTLTGGDSVRAEKKGGESVSVTINAKFFFYSNFKPRLEEREADLRRIIYSEVSPIKGQEIPQNTYDELLYNEAPDFLGFCISTYLEVCPKHGPIPNEKSQVTELVTQNQEDLHVLAEKHLYFYPNNLEEKECDKYSITIEEMADIMHNGELRTFAQKNRWKRFLETEYGVVQKFIKKNGYSSRRYLNCRLKGMGERQENQSKSLLHLEDYIKK